jgi:tetraacyldisaccharide 4'-kinase
MVKLLRYLLFPFALLYGGIVAFRNYLFDKKILKSSQFDVKIIQVGNLSAGGTGKTPHIEYLIRLLKPEYKITTLSRGYGRKTTGFVFADDSSTAKEIGDEPLQFYKKFKEIEVAVDAKRVSGVFEIMSKENTPDLILLDDAFQHRQIKTGFSILLTDYNSPFYRDFMLPTGNLREFSYGKKRADAIVVTKCPELLSEEIKKQTVKRIGAGNIPVFFSKIQYGQPVGMFNKEEISLSNYEEILLVTGIANPKPLQNQLDGYSLKVTHLKFLDHHPFTAKNIQLILSTFKAISSEKKALLTTEKDAMRLKEFQNLRDIEIVQIPIEIQLIGEEKKFNTLIKNYAESN